MIAIKIENKFRGGKEPDNKKIELQKLNLFKLQIIVSFKLKINLAN